MDVVCVNFERLKDDSGRDDGIVELLLISRVDATVHLFAWNTVSMFDKLTTPKSFSSVLACWCAGSHGETPKCGQISPRQSLRCTL